MAGPGEQEDALEIPTNKYAPALVNQLIVPGHVLVYGFTAFSSNAATQYAVLFDANALPADTAVPIFAVDLGSNVLRGVSYLPCGREFLTGFCICTSSTATTKTLNATADTFFDVQYDTLA